MILYKDIKYMQWGSAFVGYANDGEGFTWVYFLYSESMKDLYHLRKEFDKIGGIIEFETNNPSLFKNNSIQLGNGVFEYIRAKRGANG